MDKDRALNKKRCEAMIAADINDPESQDGKDFCVNCCPYEYCVVMEHPETMSQQRKRKNADLARRLRAYRVSTDDIALILHTHRRNVMRWLKK